MSNSIPDKTDVLAHEQRRSRRPQTSKTFKRSANKVMAGIAGGLAEYLDANPFIVRSIMLAALVFTLGIAGIAYLILWGLLPKA